MAEWMSGKGVDMYQARELYLYIENDPRTYKRFMAFFENYSLKRKRGVFDKQKAIKGLLIVVREGITLYNREFGGMSPVSQATKMRVAKELFDKMWTDYGLKNVRKAKKGKAKTRGRR